MINCSTLTKYGKETSPVHIIYMEIGVRNSTPNTIESNIDSQGLISNEVYTLLLRCLWRKGYSEVNKKEQKFS